MKKIKRILICAVLITVCFLLETTVFQKLAFASIIPNLLIIVTSSFGFMRGQKEGMIIGFFCGLLKDILGGNLLGFYALIYMYVGFISGYTYRIYYDNDLKVPILLAAAMDFFYNLAVYGFQFLLRGRMNLFTYLYRIIIPEIVYTVFLTVIVYRIFYYINHHFMTPVRKESESIWVLK